MERKKVIIAFGDIRGFTAFTRRAAPEEKIDLLRFVYSDFQRLVDPNKYFVKYDGDGIMILKELDQATKNTEIHDFLIKVYGLGVKVRKSIDNSYPRPDGFLVRVAMGMSFKMMVKNPYGGKPSKVPEYVDYPVNLAKRLHEVYRTEHTAICTGNIGQIIKNSPDSGIIAGILDKPEIVPHGIDVEDVSDLMWFSHDVMTDR